MKKLLSIILAVVLVLSGLVIPASAYSFNDNENFATVGESETITAGDYTYKILSNGTAEITAYTGTDTEIYIPSMLDGYVVTSIGDYSFKDNLDLTDVFVPDTVTNIGEGAFYHSISLANILLPDSISTIGYEAFYCCVSLTEISLPKNITYIGLYAFAYTSLIEITIPDKINRIEPYMFTGCRDLQSVSIPNSVTEIGHHVFSSCSSLEKIGLPDSVAFIGEGAFGACSALSEINIPNGVEGISSGTFEFCNNLKDITLPDSITYIGANAFRGTSLKEITIPDGVTYIGAYAFRLTPLKKIVIPDGVTVIEYGTFWDADLEEITIPASVTEIGDCGLGSCVIYGYIGTTAEEYATAYNKSFIALNVVEITAEATNQTISLNWDEPSNAIKYWIYVNGVCYGSTTDTTYSITNRKAFTSYNIEVKAMLSDGSTISLYGEKPLKVTTTLPDTVVNGTSLSGLTTATLSWDKLEGATKYWIYTGNEEGTEYRLYKSTTENSLNLSGLKADSTYYYKVTALVDGKITSLENTEAIIVYTAYSTPFIMDTTDSSIAVEWCESENADKYWVMISSTTNDISDLSQWKIMSTTDTACTLNGLESGTEYNICVRARYEMNGAYKTSDYDIITQTTL